MKNIFFGLMICLGFCSLLSHAQSIPVGTPLLEDYYRRAQLLGDFDPNVSFTLRPIFPFSSFDKTIFDPENSLEKKNASTIDPKLQSKRKNGIIILPVQLLSQLNTHHPEGINDGAMIPARGMQTMMSAGVYAKFGPLSLQLRPEFISAKNLAFEGYPQDYTTPSDIDFPSYPYRGIDFPERFGNDTYNKVFWGQSSIRLTLKGVSLGLSNENLWWGPGYRNSLLMTNSAGGFKHITLNTVKPIKTIIGSFEAQLIAGKLEGSGYTENIREDWRYINAMVLSYQPKWIPGLFLGVSRSFLVYNTDMGIGLGDYLPVFSFLAKSSGGGEEVVNHQGQNQLISAFMRWLFKEAHGEIYFEFGREDHSWDARDFILEPKHSSAYILGLRKLYSLNAEQKTYLQFIIESTHMASSETTINRNRNMGNATPASNWYAHTSIRQGYTNEGQLIGAGIGPGSNLQTLDISWVKALKQIGVQMERYVHNNDFWYNYIEDLRANWVDISTTAYVNWDYKNLLFSFKLKHIKSYNYQWMYEPDYGDNAPTFWAASKNTHNFHGQLGIMYRF